MTPETPRTEALWLGLKERHWGRGDQPICDIMQSHEQLERELDFERKVAKQIHAANERLEAKLAAERALADRLAAKLQGIEESADDDELGSADFRKCCRYDIPKALAAWKEARK